MELKATCKRAVNFESWNEVKNFLVGVDQSQSVDLIKEAFSFPSSIFILLGDGSDLWGLGALVPAFHERNKNIKREERETCCLPDPESLKRTPNKVWELRFYGNGQLFKILSGITSIDPQCWDQEVEDYYHKKEISGLRRNLTSDLNKPAIIVDKRVKKEFSATAQNSCFLIKALAHLSQRSEIITDLNGYEALLLK